MRALIPLVATMSLACAGADPTSSNDDPRNQPAISIADVAVVRNVLAAPTAELVLDTTRVSVPYDVQITSSDEARVPSTTARCTDARCVVDLGALPEETFEVAMTATVGDLSAEAMVASAPRWVATPDIATLRETLEVALDGDVIGFEPSAFATEQTIVLDMPIDVTNTVVMEGPQAP